MKYFLFSLFVGVVFGFMLTGFQGGFNNYMQHDQLYQYDYTSVGHRAYPQDDFVRVDEFVLAGNTKGTVEIGRDIQSSGPSRSIDQPLDGSR